MPANRSGQHGLTLVELLVAIAVGLLVVGGAVTAFNQTIEIVDSVTEVSEMQQNARAALNLIVRDISIVGTGIPIGGIPFPNGAGSTGLPLRPGAIGAFPFNGGVISAITPGDGVGPTLAGGADTSVLTRGPLATDAITLVYVDESLNLGEFPLASITPAGSQIRVDPATDITDPATGIQIGDIIFLSNSNGAAVGVVTNVPGGNRIDFANNDPLNLNQPSAAFGNIAALANPPPPAGNYPPTRAVRIYVISYYLEDTPTGPRLMRQVNATPPVPVALNIDNLQFSFDVFDTAAGVATSDLANPATPNQIRKVNIALSARSAHRNRRTRDYYRLNLVTHVGARNLSFRDRYPG